MLHKNNKEMKVLTQTNNRTFFLGNKFKVYEASSSSFISKNPISFANYIETLGGLYPSSIKTKFKNSGSNVIDFDLANITLLVTKKIQDLLYSPSFHSYGKIISNDTTDTEDEDMNVLRNIIYTYLKYIYFYYDLSKDVYLERKIKEVGIYYVNEYSNNIVLFDLVKIFDELKFYLFLKTPDDPETIVTSMDRSTGTIRVLNLGQDINIKGRGKIDNNFLSITELTLNKILETLHTYPNLTTKELPIVNTETHNIKIPDQPTPSDKQQRVNLLQEEIHYYLYFIKIRYSSEKISKLARFLTKVESLYIEDLNEKNILYQIYQNLLEAHSIAKKTSGNFS